MRKIGEIAIAAVEHLERWVQNRTGLVVPDLRRRLKNAKRREKRWRERWMGV